MARATHLIFFFLSGCVAANLLNWLAAQLPQGIGAIIAANLIILIIWAAGWILDDGLIHLIKIQPLSYYTSLIGWGITHLIGLGVFLWIYQPALQP